MTDKVKDREVSITYKPTIEIPLDFLKNPCLETSLTNTGQLYWNLIHILTMMSSTESIKPTVVDMHCQTFSNHNPILLMGITKHSEITIQSSITNIV